MNVLTQNVNQKWGFANQFFTKTSIWAGIINHSLTLTNSRINGLEESNSNLQGYIDESIDNRFLRIEQQLSNMIEDLRKKQASTEQENFQGKMNEMHKQVCNIQTCLGTNKQFIEEKLLQKPWKEELEDVKSKMDLNLKFMIEEIRSFGEGRVKQEKSLVNLQRQVEKVIEINEESTKSTQKMQEEISGQEWSSNP